MSNGGGGGGRREGGGHWGWLLARLLAIWAIALLANLRELNSSFVLFFLLAPFLFYLVTNRNKKCAAGADFFLRTCSELIKMVLFKQATPGAQ